jgi:hypothetical protein
MVLGVLPISADQAQRPDPVPVQGVLTNVDADAKLITIKPAEGAEVQFQYDEATQIEGAKTGAAGLASMKDAQVTIHFKEDGKAKLATRIIVQPRQQ